MKKLLNHSLKRFLVYAAIVLVASVPAYYMAISWLWQYELDEHNIVLTPEASREDKLLIIGAVTIITVVFFILLLGGFILINRKVSQRLWQPFYKSLEKTRDFDISQHKTVVFDKTDISEFAELNESLYKLITGSAMAYHQQKEFADNASHELQTPLAIVQSKLEMLLQTQSLTTDQYTNIEQALKALSRVSRINKNLLLLAKIENSQYLDKEVIDLAQLLDNTISLFAIFSEDKNIELTKKIAGVVQVEANKILVELVLQNLITNAILHSPYGSIVSVTLNDCLLSITNPGACSLAQEQLFKRFASASSQTPGTGLGLALIKQVCTRYNWRITYDFTGDLHIFSIVF